MLLPKHKRGLSMTHNEHKDYYDYESLSEYLDYNDMDDDFSSDDDRRLAIEKDELWVLRWYPNTLVGHYDIAASSFSKLMSYMEECCSENKLEIFE